MKNLIERFRNNISDYKSQRYDEENTKIDFIDKFFEALGWDVYNTSGASEDFREVIREDKVVIKGRPKSPDYSFRIGKERQFFVEAKKPSVNIYEDVKPAFQVRRYAYSAGLPISILTDFEEFSIYDTTIKPNEKDKASVARIFYCTFEEYEKNWEFLNETISKQAVWQGKLKKYTGSDKKKKGTQSIDKELLKLIELWRENLAKNIAIRNKNIDIYQLNDAVQKIIDRIIFLRMAEDRQTEVYNTLVHIADNNNIYNTLVKYFDSSNKKYNSGLFENKDWLNALAIDDKVFKAIIKDLYYPNPYEFSVLPIEILGHIYEQFLGKTIRLTPGHMAKIEEKPEVRKAGGVYYTPKYIVDYIVDNTVGKKIEGHTPKQIAKLSILDPACGSGSFLVGAYKYLLEYHYGYYTDRKHIQKAIKDNMVYQSGDNKYSLTLRAKREILLNNIYGVDIDSQAVEVTKLSLLLTLMEGEIIEASTELFLKNTGGAILPDLSGNIKCGNSLIGTDFYADKDLQLFTYDEQRKINCFDWEDEFSEIMGAGGFDCVIGNPPYVLFESEEEKKHLRKKFESVIGKPDLYKYFIEKGLQLTKKNGGFGFIIPSSLLTIPSAKLIRKNLLEIYGLNRIVVFKGEVFEKVSVNSLILFASPKNSNSNSDIEVVIDNEIRPNQESLCNSLKNKYYMNKSLWIKEKEYCFFLIDDYEKQSLLEKIEKQSLQLTEFCNYTLGMQVYHNSIHSQDIIKNRTYHSKVRINNTYYPESGGRNIKRYFFYDKFKEFVSYGDWCYNKPDIEFIVQPRILVREIPSSTTLICTYSETKHISNKAVIILISKDINLKYILGLINSKLLGFYILSKGHKSDQWSVPIFLDNRLR